MPTEDSYLDSLLTRINSAMCAGDSEGQEEIACVAAATMPAANRQEHDPATSLPTDNDTLREIADAEFWPLAPASWEDMKLSPATAEELALKFLMNHGTASGREIAEHIAVPFGLLTELLAQAKINRLVTLRGAAPFGDYLYQLCDGGIEAASRYMKQCAYDGAAPIALEDYIKSVEAQSIHKHSPTYDQTAVALKDLVLAEDVVEQIGQAIHAGHGFFLYGESGNGKTSVAERVSRIFGETIWIPRSLCIDGCIIRLFDPCNHTEVPPENKDGLYDRLKIDSRWVRIKRPTIIAGGELTMERLEICPSSVPGVNEAPLQLKSNNGTLVIDDFGRQRMKASDLLNRWIVPLDRQYDFLNLPNGKTIQVPFDQLLVFSTNMEPHDLADEAFLRRIPYKIRALDPTEDQFRELFRRESQRMGIEYRDEAMEDLIETHYKQAGRPFRCCHARDLLKQIKHGCEFRNISPEMTKERFAAAVRNYFALVKTGGGSFAVH